MLKFFCSSVILAPSYPRLQKAKVEKLSPKYFIRISLPEVKDLMYWLLFSQSETLKLWSLPKKKPLNYKQMTNDEKIAVTSAEIYQGK